MGSMAYGMELHTQMLLLMVAHAMRYVLCTTYRVLLIIIVCLVQ